MEEYATFLGCGCDGSLLRHNIWEDIVYCYLSDDFNGIKNFNGIVIISVLTSSENDKMKIGNHYPVLIRSKTEI
jgi:hypothetical protein